jgi:hypothetical protein
VVQNEILIAQNHKIIDFVVLVGKCRVMDIQMREFVIAVYKIFEAFARTSCPSRETRNYSVGMFYMSI